MGNKVRLRCGSIREDGMVFWGFDKTYPSGEYWVTPEKFRDMRERQREYRNDPAVKARLSARHKERMEGDPAYRERRRDRLRELRQDPEYREKERVHNKSYLSDPIIKERTREYLKGWYADPAVKERRSARHKERMDNDPLFALACRARNRIYIALARNGYHKSNKTKQMLGCSFAELKVHIENQFVEGMSWDNRSEWHIDHIKPLASANTEEELLALCHFTNLQPLWAFDNMSKGSKIPLNE
jgi:hypothetical protein